MTEKWLDELADLIQTAYMAKEAYEKNRTAEYHDMAVKAVSAAFTACTLGRLARLVEIAKERSDVAHH